MANYEFGAPLLTRTSEISTKCAKSTTLFPLEVMGKYQGLKQITVRIGVPVYRMQNGRTRTYQKEYLATHPDVTPDLFTFDPESIAAQKAQHTILQKLAEDEDLYKEFSSGTKQTEPIVVTNTGVVVNGNRRLCVWRTLFSKDPSEYKHFEYIDVAVLPEDCDEDEIRALEKRLQIQKSHKAPYKWHTRAAMMKAEREEGKKKAEIAASYDVQNQKDVDTIISALEYAELYLQKIGKRDQWSLVNGDEFAFKAMVIERQKITDQGKKELFEAVCFKLIEAKDYQGRLYNVIPDIAENLEEVADELRSKGLIPSVPATPANLDTGTSMESADDLDLLGGEATPVDPYSALATAIQESDEKIAGVVKQVIDEQKSLKSEQKSSQYLVNTLAKVAKFLWSAEIAGLNENAATAGVRAQLDTIKERIAVIEKWLENK